MNLKTLNNDSICSIDSDGTKKWRNKKYKYHRRNGPAVEYADGGKEWHVNGKLHRENGPAVECANGDKEWWVNSKLHREDGPAVEYANGHKEWWVNNVSCFTEKDYWLKLYKLKLITKKELFLKLL